MRVRQILTPELRDTTWQGPSGAICAFLRLPLGEDMDLVVDGLRSVQS